MLVRPGDVVDEARLLHVSLISLPLKDCSPLTPYHSVPPALSHIRCSCLGLIIVVLRLLSLPPFTHGYFFILFFSRMVIFLLLPLQQFFSLQVCNCVLQFLLCVCLDHCHQI